MSQKFNFVASSSKGVVTAVRPRPTTFWKRVSWTIQRWLGRSDIVINDSIYMTRWRFINAPRWLGGWGLRVHRIVRSDEDRELHDHPFSFLSIILWGGYTEERGVPFWAPGESHEVPPWTRTVHRSYGAGSIIFRRAEMAHRLTLDRVTWTFVVRGPIRRQWGFYTDAGWVAWHDFVQARGEST